MSEGKTTIVKMINQVAILYSVQKIDIFFFV